MRFALFVRLQYVLARAATSLPIAFGLEGGSKRLPGHRNTSGSQRCPRPGCGGALRASATVSTGYVCKKCGRPLPNAIQDG